MYAFPISGGNDFSQLANLALEVIKRHGRNYFKNVTFQPPSCREIRSESGLITMTYEPLSQDELMSLRQIADTIVREFNN